MTLEEFNAKAKIRLAKFVANYRKNNRQDPELYPIDQLEMAWYHQLAVSRSEDKA